MLRCRFRNWGKKVKRRVGTCYIMGHLGVPVAACVAVRFTAKRVEEKACVNFLRQPLNINGFEKNGRKPLPIHRVFVTLHAEATPHYQDWPFLIISNRPGGLLVRR